jgi:hypothetical protein
LTARDHIRRAAVFLTAAVVAGLLVPAIAVAHGIQGRADLPIPTRAFYWASAVVLVVSFVGLALGWRRPLLAGLLDRRSRPWSPGRGARLALGAGRVASVAMLALVLATAAFGSTDLNANFAPIWIFVAWWIGIALLAATVGDWWRAVHPVAVLARLLRLPEGSTGALPARVGLWVAFAGLFAFTWLELVYPTAAHVRLLGGLTALWAVATLVAMQRYGIDEVLDRVEPFAAYTNLLGALGCVGLRGASAGGGVEVRPPVLGVLRIRPRRGLAAFTGLLIGSVSFDGLSRTAWWRRHATEGAARLTDAGLGVTTSQVVLGTVGLACAVALAIVAFLAFARLAAIVGRLPGRTRSGPVAIAFAPSLVPIAFAYVVAHYCSFFWFQSQQVVRLASDPFGRGWDLFGTAGFQVDYTTLSANAIWIVQVVAIVVGHVLALVLAHDRALEVEAGSPGARGVRSQWPMLALMVLYTVGGLYFLSEGLNA